GAWFAGVVPDDVDHARAAGWLARNTRPLLTTDLVVGETLTLLRARRKPRLAISLGDAFFDGSLARVYHLTESDIRSGWDVFRRFSDKEWSFTDCASKVVLERFKLTVAFAFDHHFSQFGSVRVVP